MLYPYDTRHGLRYQRIGMVGVLPFALSAGNQQPPGLMITIAGWSVITTKKFIYFIFWRVGEDKAAVCRLGRLLSRLWWALFLDGNVSLGELGDDQGENEIISAKVTLEKPGKGGIVTG